MIPQRKPSMPSPDMEDELLADPPADMIPARGANERAAIAEALFQRMQNAGPEEKAQLAELLSRVNAESDMSKPGADMTMTQPFIDALMRLSPEQRDELMQMAGGLGSMDMPPEMMVDEAGMADERFEPPAPNGIPGQMPLTLPPEGLPESRGDQIPAYMARQQDMPPQMPQQGGMDLMALLSGGGQMPQPPMNMGSKPFLSGLMN